MSEKKQVTPLPIKLGKEPLIDVVFEVRFTGTELASNVLPGLLYGSISGLGSMESLPMAQMPQQFRNSDPHLQHLPLMRVWYGNYALLVGDRSLAIGCKMPYPGWKEYKVALSRILSVLSKASWIQTIDRYSVKYVDFFKKDEDASPDLSSFKLSVDLGGDSINSQSLNLRVEIPQENFIHAVQIFNHADLVDPVGHKHIGSILDVDTVCNLSNCSLAEFQDGLSDKLDKIHLANKHFFFKCLSDEGLLALDPVYD